MSCDTAAAYRGRRERELNGHAHVERGRIRQFISGGEHLRESHGPPRHSTTAAERAVATNDAIRTIPPRRSFRRVCRIIHRAADWGGILLEERRQRSPLDRPAIGVVAGLVGGMLIGGIERRRRGDLVRPDLATMIGGIFGLGIALVAFVSGMASVRGNLTAFGLIGMAMAFPTAGILIGGLFDRSYEAAQNSRWRDAGVCCVVAVSASLSLIWLMLTYPTGTSAEDLVRPLTGMIYTEIRAEPEMRNAVVKNVVLVRRGNRDYSGTFEIVVKDRTHRYRVDAQLNDQMLSAAWHLDEE